MTRVDLLEDDQLKSLTNLKPRRVLSHFNTPHFELDSTRLFFLQDIDF